MNHGKLPRINNKDIIRKIRTKSQAKDLKYKQIMEIRNSNKSKPIQESHEFLGINDSLSEPQIMKVIDEYLSKSFISPRGNNIYNKISSLNSFKKSIIDTKTKKEEELEVNSKYNLKYHFCLIQKMVESFNKLTKNKLNLNNDIFTIKDFIVGKYNSQSNESGKMMFDSLKRSKSIIEFLKSKFEFLHNNESIEEFMLKRIPNKSKIPLLKAKSQFFKCILKRF